MRRHRWDDHSRDLKPHPRRPDEDERQWRLDIEDDLDFDDLDDDTGDGDDDDPWGVDGWRDAHGPPRLRPW